MKLIFHSLLFIVMPLAMQARPLHSKVIDPVKQRYHDSYRNILLQQAGANAGNKGTNASRRLLANSYTSSGAIQDSNYYYYSGSRGSVITADLNSYYDQYNPAATSTDLSLFVDSSINWNSTGYMTMKKYTYDANSRVIELEELLPYDYIGYKLTYNANNNPQQITVLVDTDHTLTLVPQSHIDITYNSQHKRTQDSITEIGTGIVNTNRLYTYDASGNLLTTEFYYTITGILKLSDRITNTYDAFNRLVTTVDEADLGSGLQNENKDSFAYIGNSMQPYYEMDQEWNTSNHSWRMQEITTKSYNTQNMLDTEFFYHYNGAGIDTVERDIYVYDSDNLLNHSNGFLYGGQGQYDTTPYDANNYYYDTFPTSVANTTTKYDVAMYPNPTGNTITITSALRQPGSISIYDATGRLMQHINNASLAHQQVDVSRYVKGDYFMSVTDSKGALIFRSAFTKL